jgi:sec-independent protein translocase protein TatA
MSLANLGSHWWVILIIVVLLFGAPKLPALAKSMGQSMRIFKSEIKSGKEEDAAAAANVAPVQTAAPVQTPAPVQTAAPVQTSAPVQNGAPASVDGTGDQTAKS